MNIMRTVALTKESTKDILENLLKRSPNNYGKFEAAVDEILNKVKTEGDAALFAYTKEFDKTEISADTIKVTEEEIKEAYEKALMHDSSRITDDAMVVETMLCTPVKLYEGSYDNIKITTPEDMVVAEAFLNAE